jgi:hypothetical protein
VQARVNPNLKGKSSPALQLNEVGDFERVQVKTGQKIEVELSFPQSKEGENVFLQAEDGGRFQGDKVIEVQSLGPERKSSFQFEVGRNRGIYRISVRHQDSLAVLNFWAEPGS